MRDRVCRVLDVEERRGFGPLLLSRFLEIWLHGAVRPCRRFLIHRQRVIDQRVDGPDLIGRHEFGGDLQAERRDRGPVGVEGERPSRSRDIAGYDDAPLGAGVSVSEPVAEAVRLVRQSGLPNETNAMFTNVEGDWDQVMALIKACVKVAEATPRVSVVIKIDHRPGVAGALQNKVEAVEERLRGR